MNKTELVAALAEKTQLPKKNAELALNAVVEVITESLSKGGADCWFWLFRGEGSSGTHCPQSAEARRGDYHPGFQGACFQGWQVPQGRCQSVIVLNTIF